MTVRNDRTGQVHGTFKVLGFSRVIDGSTFWSCECTNCGSTVERHNRYFRKDRGIPKGCINCKQENHFLFKGVGEIPRTFLSRIRFQAEERSYQFNVTDEFLWDLFLTQERKCFYTGLEIGFSKEEITASLDRIDSSRSYENDNIVWCHKDVNKMKLDMDINRFLEICKLISLKEPKVDPI